MLKKLFNPTNRLMGGICSRFGFFRAYSSDLNKSDVDDYYQLEISDSLQELIEESTEMNEKILKLQPFQSPLREAIQEKLRYEWIYNSNAIEGSTLSLGDTIFFLKEGLTVQGKPFKDYLDARNHEKAIDFFFDIVADKIPLSPHLMCQINSLLMEGVDFIPAIDQYGRKTSKPTHPGTYKKEPNHVLLPNGEVHYYVEPIQVASQMDFLFQWINQNITRHHPIVTSALGHYNMVRIHPYDDANGRGSRILMNLILNKRNYPIAVIKNEDRQEYLKSLNEGDKKNLEPFIKFVAKAVISTQRTILNELKRFEDFNDNSVSRKM